MAKGQISEEDLASGIRSLGGLGSLTPGRRDSPFRDSRVEEKTVDIQPAKEVTPQPGPIAVPVEKRVRIAKPPAPPVEPMPVERHSRAEKNGAKRKADIYTERITLQISPEMRDEVDSLARELQRSKSSKGERITANSVMRVAIRSFLEVFEQDGGNIDTEEDLYQTVKKGRPAG